MKTLGGVWVPSHLVTFGGMDFSAYSPSLFNALPGTFKGTALKETIVGQMVSIADLEDFVPISPQPSALAALQQQITDKMCAELGIPPIEFNQHGHTLYSHRREQQLLRSVGGHRMQYAWSPILKAHVRIGESVRG